MPWVDKLDVILAPAEERVLLGIVVTGRTRDRELHSDCEAYARDRG